MRDKLAFMLLLTIVVALGLLAAPLFVALVFVGAFIDSLSDEQTMARVVEECSSEVVREVEELQEHGLRLKMI